METSVVRIDLTIVEMDVVIGWLIPLWSFLNSERLLMNRRDNKERLVHASVAQWIRAFG